MIAGLLLAAGASRRFGSPKLTVPIEGGVVVEQAARALSRLVNQLFAVIPPDSPELEAVLHKRGARIVVNAAHAEGMASSIREGIAALPVGVGAVVVALGDQPRPDLETSRAVVRRWREHRDAIVVPRYRGIAGHPVMFDQRVFAELLDLKGDGGAKSVVERDPARVAYIDVDRPAPADIDTPADLAQFSNA